MSATKAKAAIAAETAATLDSAAEVSAKSFEKSISAVREGIEKATKGLETSQAKLKEGVEKAMKSSEEILAFGQGNVEAFMQASQVYVAGFQDISKYFAESSKASLDDTVAFSKSLMGVKSVKEAMDLHAGFARSSLEKAVTESNKLADVSVKLMEKSLAPLTARMTLAAETFGKV